MTTAEPAQEAQAIVRGNVAALRSKWNEEKTYIWSLVTVAVSESLKGEDVSGRNIEMKIASGVVGEVEQISSDQVRFEEGEEVVVLLGRESYQGSYCFNVVRLVQGKFTVRDRKIEGRAVEDFMQEVTRALKLPEQSN